jgi:hypothetical protein
MIKVNDWSVKLLTAVVSFHYFRLLVELKYSEQSALEEMLKDVGSNFFIQSSSNVRNMLLIITLRYRYVDASSKYHNTGSMRIRHLREKMPFLELMSSVLGAYKFISPATGTASETPAWTPGWILLSSKVQNGYCRQNIAD